MSFSQLPTEILWAIASYLPRQNDIYALVRTNRRLHQSLEECLHYRNAQYYHGSALSFAAKHSGLVPHIQNLLVGLDIARTLPHSISSFRKAKRYTGDEETEEEESSDEEDPSDDEESSDEDCHQRRMPRRRRNLDGRLDRTDPYWEDVYTHPLLLQGYCISSILNIQHALVVGIQAMNTEAIHALLQFGAGVNFYRGSRAERPFSTYSRTLWHSNRVDIDNPPLFTAAQYGHVEIVKKLLECGADAQRYTPSPLYRAVEDGRRDLISVLLRHDARTHKAALKLAVLRKDYPLVEFLLSVGLNAAEHGHAGLYVAEMKGYTEIANLLKLRGATVDALSEADKRKWAVEDKDGTDRPKYFRCSTLHGDVEIDEPE